MPIIYQHRYTKNECLINPEVLYVFGDNLLNVGYAGQAIIRGAPNAVGLYTKKSPMEYLTDTDLELVLQRSEKRRHRLELHFNRRGTIIWPKDNIGTGLAALRQHAPMIADYWNGFLNHLDGNYHMRTVRI